MKKLITVNRMVKINDKRKSIIDELNRINYDVKAESLVNNLILGGCTADDFIISFESIHKKNWEKDLHKAELLGNKVLLKLTRNGFFQSLPEYLFLKPVEGSKEDKEQIIEFNKNQINYAKTFFNPVENEIFNNGVFLEEFENDQITSLSYGDNKSIFDFWRIDFQLHEHDYIKFCKIIPTLHSIVGDLTATANCLSYLLDSNVTVKLEKRLQTSCFSDETNNVNIGLGNCKCGNDFILGSALEENESVFIFTIGPISDNEVVHYLENGHKQKLLDCFVSYFIPMQYESEFVIGVCASDSGFSLNNSYLGFNTIFNL